MITLHLMVGLPCSGKTTYAKELAITENALLLTPDVWHWQLYGQDFPGPYHDKRHNEIEKIMWDVAKRVLSLGVSVILDFGFWNKIERIEFRERARILNVNFKIHYMDIAKTELYTRLVKRNEQAGDKGWRIPPSYLELWYSQFEPPTSDELFE